MAPARESGRVQGARNRGLESCFEVVIARVLRRRLAIAPLTVDQRRYGESTGRLPTCPQWWAERAAAGDGPTARLFEAPIWVGGVSLGVFRGSVSLSLVLAAPG